MKKYVTVSIMTFLAACVLLTGCYTSGGRPYYAASGALTGGAIGAVVGSMTRHSGPGAIIGGTMGAVVGSLIGSGMDQAREAQLKEQSPLTLQRIEQAQPLEISDIKSLVKAGFSDDLVISQIRNSGTVYHLRTADIIDLKNSGVSERIIDFMINTPAQIQPLQVSGAEDSAPAARVVEKVVVVPGPWRFRAGGTWLWFGYPWVWHPGYWHMPPPPHYHSRHRR